MTEKWKEEQWAEDIWYRGKLTRRRLVGWGGGVIGAMILVPAPWRAAFGAAKPYKIGSEQPLSGAGGAGGKTAVVGLQMAVDRINNSGGINGRPVELVMTRVRRLSRAKRLRRWCRKITSTPMSAASSPTSVSPVCLFGRRLRS
jgi:hypothetical protein